jgi:hypothetical protein
MHRCKRTANNGAQGAGGGCGRVHQRREGAVYLYANHAPLHGLRRQTFLRDVPLKFAHQFGDLVFEVAPRFLHVFTQLRRVALGTCGHV